jgi:NAD(P)-dependent dehydrogenase (short-subunit alcohol dehydrogenase family)
MTEDDLRGARVIVTGASRGIGQGVAAMFCAEGATVAGLDLRDGEETAQLCAGAFRHFHCDLARPDQIASAFADVDRWFDGSAPDVLVCVAGISPEVAFIDTPTEVFDEVFAVNVRAVFLCGQEAARRMRDAGGGRIVNIASTASVQAWAMQAVYGASKGAVALLTKCMAIELAAHGITVNAVGPGTIETPLAEHFLTDPRMRANEVDRAPLGRLGTPEDIAAAVRFLARDARWMTGQVINVDGGFLAAGLTMAPGDETRVSLER